LIAKQVVLKVISASVNILNSNNKAKPNADKKSENECKEKPFLRECNNKKKSFSWFIDFGLKENSTKHEYFMHKQMLSINSDPVGASMKECSDKDSESNAISNHHNVISSRKYFNLERWYCISRPQYKFSCGISSLVSCWNYLYSTLGHGNLQPLKVEYALKMLGFSEPFDEIKFGPFTGNATLIEWFHFLNKKFGVFGYASFFYKPVGKEKTSISESEAKESFKTLLKSKNNAFIYHCHNHYCCPIGFELEPVEPSQIFEANQTEFVEWILVADTSKKYPCFHCVKWEDMNKDLNMKYPEYLNIRQLDKGVQMLDKNKKAGGNIHCLMIFKKY